LRKIAAEKKADEDFTKKKTEQSGGLSVAAAGCLEPTEQGSKFSRHRRGISGTRTSEAALPGGVSRPATDDL